MRYLLSAVLLVQADDGLEKLKDSAVQKALKLELDDALPAEIGAAWAAAVGKVGKAHKAAASARASQWYVKAWGGAGGQEKLELRVALAALAGVPDVALAPVKAPGGAPGWDWWGPCISDARFYRSGRVSAKIAPPNGKTPDGRAGISCTLFPVAPGTEYTASVWAFSFWSDTDITFDFHYFDIKGTLLAQGASVLVPADEPWWHRLEMKVTIPPGVARGRVVVGGKFTNGVVWVDDLEITAAGKPVTIKNAGFEDR